MDTPTLRERIASDMDRHRADLERLVRIPSVSFPGWDQANVRRSAEATAEILEAAGLSDVRVFEIPGGNPAVIGGTPAPDGAPRVLLYAHHDVQPPGPEDLWDSPPFEPSERDGRLFARGTSDDKCGIVMHAAAIRAWEGRPPVHVKVVVEGEEESSTEHLPYLIESNAEALAADIVVVADSGSWRRGEPALTTTLRGVVDVTVEVRVLDRAAHSGGYGGAAPDALTTLVRTLATLHDDRGNVLVPGLTTTAPPSLEWPEDEFRAEAGVRPGVRLIGEGTISERVWAKPAISILGIDAPSVDGSYNQLLPLARGRVSLRLAPNDDPERALDALSAFLESNAPWGAEVRVTRGDPGEGFEETGDGPIFEAARRALADAWGRPAVDMGSGGSVPMVAEFRKHFRDATFLLTGAGDELSGAHSSNESVDLVELERACVAEALLLANLANDS